MFAIRRQRAACNAYPQPSTTTASSTSPSPRVLERVSDGREVCITDGEPEKNSAAGTPITATRTRPRFPPRRLNVSQTSSSSPSYASSYSSGVGELARAVRHEESLGARGLERLHRLVEGEVTARLAVELAPEQRRLADEEVGVARRLDELLRGRRVARVREHRAVRLHAEGVRLEPVVRARASV